MSSTYRAHTHSIHPYRVHLPLKFSAMAPTMTNKDQPTTLTDDDFKTRAEVHDIREADKESKSREEVAKEPDSATNVKVQVDDEDDEFDEDADWSDKEEEKVYDIVERYNCVWSEGSGVEGAAYEGHSINICGSANQNQIDKPFRCTAVFMWRDLFAQLTCIYRPETQTFTNFKAKRKTLDAGM